MIVTVTPNPSIDRTIAVETLERGHVNRATSVFEEPGGKGVNVSRALAANGTSTLALVPVGHDSESTFSDLLTAASVPHSLVDQPGSVRTNITLAEADGTTTKVNEAGRTCDPADTAALIDAVDSHIAGANWLVGCGSLPPGLDTDIYARLVELAHRRGIRVAIDTSDAPFAHAVAARPDVVKPNRHELEEFAGRPLETLGDVLGAAQSLVDSGITTVLVSLGSDGAVAVTASGVTHAVAVVDAPRSTVAAGDCFLAGWLHATSRGATDSDALATAVRWGSAAVLLPGSAVPHPEDLTTINVEVLPSPVTTLKLTSD
ncbi:1-phosphofructokinase [Demequina flava]|uniref:1-phosphofructokinase n=1 Tax=Demequina flava TaxID=1095025 RepID=UPI000780552E|nr:1-phosphofructokinase [Demequina flava]